MKSIEDVLGLIHNGETHNVEFKSKYESDKVGQALCSLTNDWPEMGIGYLIIGVTDENKTIVGFTESEDDIQQNVANICRTAISPPIAPVMYITKLDKPVLVVELNASSGAPRRYKNECYIRIGTTTRKADSSEEFELAQRMKARTYYQIVGANSLLDLKSDLPPINNKWVGRTDEITQLDNDNFKAIFITGIGGQGKSGLASYYTKKVDQDKHYEFWDWRDFKEEEYRLNSKIISIIERLTNRKIQADLLQNLDNYELIDTLFYHIRNRKIVFIFDNIDRYIDLKTLLPIGGMEKLLENALKIEHRCKFIFTCRPTIQYVGVGFYNLNLGGLTLDNTLKLFEEYRIPINKELITHIAAEAFELTNGHPLWLNLVAAQALRGKDTVERFLDSIKINPQALKEEFVISSANVLKTVWDNLGQNQRKVLRCMSELPRAETEENLSKMFSTILHYSKFHKALKVLKALNLIVIKAYKNEPDLYELHPLVKSFVIRKYNLKERTEYIQPLVNYFNKIIVILRKNIDTLSINDLEYWINKIELNINSENFRSALTSLEEIYKKILSSGYVEEYIRLTHALFTKIDWSTAIGREYPYFYIQLNRYITSLVELGKFEEYELQIEKFKDLSKGKDNIEYFDHQCYYCWYKQDFSTAITWGQKYWDALAVYEPGCTAPHNLLLSWRDSKETELVQKALDGFLGGELLEEVLDKSVIKDEISPQFYGNIGRCLWYQNKIDQSLKCCIKSLFLLNKENEHNTLLNQGYACQWIGDILLEKNDHANAIVFYQNAYLKWNQVSPVRTDVVTSKISGIIQLYPDDRRLIEIEDFKIEEKCKTFISEMLE